MSNNSLLKVDQHLLQSEWMLESPSDPLERTVERKIKIELKFAKNNQIILNSIETR